MIIILLVLSSAPCAFSESQIIDALNLDSIEQYAESQSFDFSRILIGLVNGSVNMTEEFQNAVYREFNRIADNFAQPVIVSLVPLSVLALLRLLFSKDSSSLRILSLVCRVSCIPALYTVFQHAETQAVALMQEVLKCSSLLSPSLITAVSLSGAETMAAFLSPMTSVCAELIQRLLIKWGTALSSSAACLAIAGSLSTRVRLNKLHQLLRQIVHWGTGVSVASFMAILSIQGRLGSGRDTAVSRTARYAIENIIPVIGGNISDSLNSLLSTAAVIKNALGVSGIMLLTYICIAPIARTLGILLLFRLLSAVSEPLCDDGYTRLTSQLADSIEMLLIISLAAAMLCALLAGSCVNAASVIIR